jgi:ferredoxin
VIDGKARLVGDLLCDGLGACVGNCPTGALTVERREAEAYDEARVMKSMLEMGANTIVAHLEHLREHNERENIEVALDVISENEFTGKTEVLTRWSQSRHGAAPAPVNAQAVRAAPHGFSGCPGSAARAFTDREDAAADRIASNPASSELTHWPVQMHLLNPASPHFAGCDFVLAADCTAFSLGAFHGEILAGKKLGIACPKLDQGQESYVDKVRSLIDDAKINTLTVVIMEVPCCGGLMRVAQMAAQQASRKVPIKQIMVGVQGEVLAETWV